MARTPKPAEVVDAGIGEAEAFKEQLLSLKKEVTGLRRDVAELVSKLTELSSNDNSTEQLEKKVEVLSTYVTVFNNFLNNSMISNNADKAAEDALTDILVALPKN